MNKIHQRGFGLIDMAVAVMVAGLLTAIFATIQQATSQRNAVSNVTDLYTRIDEAIVAFAQLNDRLPCPATDDGGVENCSGATTGQVPYLTIGLPNYEAASITYSLKAYTASDGSSVDLSKTAVPGVLQFRMSDQPTASVVPLKGSGPNGGSFNLLGLCEALTRPRASGSGGALAYSLSRVSVSSGFGIVPGYSVSVDDLAARMACGALVSSAARGYFNTVAAFAATLRNFEDYLNFENIGLQVANTDLAYGIFIVSTSGPMKVDVKKAQVQAATGVCLVDSSKCGAVGFAATDLATESAYETLNALRLARYVINQGNASANMSAMTALTAQVAAQLDAVQNRAMESAAGGVYTP
ncbi:hypothetical protein [Burkholderia seminalis]|uniref:hypothetical protein n=1 Tax=Burkholderia seminalis TaxID=488731 RepID=UPI0014535FCF|nr:hypothetical protein [Burkholderia seminalis]MCA8306764.1 hypothetical protein [Burkholderia seminalis]MCA8435266.1 hypothetical protein [Burkholderia seminalis]VWC11599.1 hypothetical protein BSE24067_05380 [Burkholderia seminalis]